MTCQIPESNTSSEREQLQSSWAMFARYSVTLSEDGDYNKKTTIAEWLTLDEARAFEQRGNAALHRANPHYAGRWAKPAYGIHLHVPKLSKGVFLVGDLAFNKIYEPLHTCPKSGVEHGRLYLRPGVITDADATGRVIAITLLDGQVLHPTTACLVYSARHIDVAGFLKEPELASRIITDVNNVQHFLVKHQIRREPIIHHPIQE